MVDHRHLEQVFRPLHSIGIGAFAGKKQGTELPEIVLREELALRIFLLDRAERRRRREQGNAAMLGDDAPKRAGIRRAHRLAFVEDGGAAMQQRRIDDVAVADHPADVGRGPVDLTRVDAVEVLHGPFQRNHVAAVVAHHAFGYSGRARSVEDVEWISRRNRHAIVDRARENDRLVAQLGPVMVAPWDESGVLLRALKDETRDRKSTRLNSSHRCISYAVFCLKKKNEYNAE